MKKILCMLFHRGSHVRSPEYGRFGWWVYYCKKCGLDWEEFEPEEFEP